MQWQEVKTKIKQRRPELIAAAITGVTIGLTFLAVNNKKPSRPRIEPFIDADGKKSFSTGTHMVLEHVEGEKNIWRDMDWPENQYQLVPHAVVWEDAV